jgi:hypothetical protein
LKSFRILRLIGFYDILERGFVLGEFADRLTGLYQLG